MKERFDAVGWMREQRVRIDRETESLSWEERRRWVRESLKDDPLWESLKHHALVTRDDRRFTGADH